jgi:TonB-dependent receptor|tara:strand:- start:2830 stop:5664 length:2835 start_codon:yes stop_codon:yes gene_type:complete
LKRLYKIIPFILTIFSNIYSQSGINGTLIDGDFNEPLPFANILIKETNEGVTSDFDGKYQIELSKGTYTLIFSFLGYETKEITNIKVSDGEFSIVDVLLNSAAEGLEEVIVTVDARQNTEASVLLIQKKSVSLLDGLSSQTFKKMGASNIANAVKQVPGVSVQGGKYVYVRGLGDRYSKSILNGIDIPGLDPDRNTIQMDLFATNLLSNILVIKSARADMPADFTGGVIDIITKEFPAKQEISFSFSSDYNPEMHFNKNYLSYDGGNYDFLGFDDGTRKNPIISTILGNPFDPRFSKDEESLNRINRLSQYFDPQMGPKISQSGMDYSLGFSYGNQFKLAENKLLGVLGSLSYKSSQEFDENTIDNIYNKDPDRSKFNYSENRLQSGSIGSENIILSGLIGLSYKSDNTKLKFNLLNIQNGESSSGSFRQLTRFSDFIDFNKSNIEYSERGITNYMLSGLHNFNETNLKIDWTIATTIAKVHDKDIRNTAFQDEEGIFSFKENTEPKRIWRYLDETNQVVKIDLTKKYELFSRDAKLKIGVYGLRKERDFSISQYSISSTYTSESDWANYQGDPNKIFNTNNLVSFNSIEGTYINPRTTINQEANIFNAKQENISAYLSNEFNFSAKFKSIIGLRFENYNLFYSGTNSQIGVALDNENVISKSDLFPSLNFIYSLSDDKNLRIAYSLTTARPSFKEASIAEIFDPLSNLFFIGNINIRPTYIDNFDIRYESFGEKSQLFALSLFYKKLTDPIEIGFVAAATSNYKPLNLSTANVIGAEIEIRKKIETFFSALKNLTLIFNGSIINSKEKFSADEIKLRTLGLREGETIGESRPLQGQSPYLINAGIDYNSDLKNLQVGIYYNVQGKTLEFVGNGFYPDVYTMPFQSLNFNLIKNLKKNRSITFKISNLLDDDKESFFQSYKAEDKYFKFRNPGRSFSLGYSISF